VKTAMNELGSFQVAELLTASEGLSSMELVEPRPSKKVESVTECALSLFLAGRIGIICEEHKTVRSEFAIVVTIVRSSGI
jgi:hypothetical protein